MEEGGLPLQENSRLLLVSHTPHIRRYTHIILREKYWPAQLYETQARCWQKY